MRSENATRPKVGRIDWMTISIVGLPVVSKRSHDSKELLKIDEYFHEKIAELTGNEEILRTLKNVNARIRFVRWIDMDNRRSATQKEHRQILEALRSRGRKAAQECMGHHIRQRLDQINANLKEGLSRIYWGEVP